eukprot:gb/GECH01003038.1/.p1 GENE.gb/GECH01003038.1/~~gb/GECH01003038.1/.p1  ORF type:complete len:346 (+),score=73.03 gb/GECH01003038.1/:1-1038(+)
MLRLHHSNVSNNSQSTLSNQIRKIGTVSAKQRFKGKDCVMNGLSEDGKIRIAVVSNTDTVSVAQEKHSLAPAPLTLLGRTMSSATMLSSFLKGEERIGIDILCKGDLQRISVESMKVGEVRGFVGNGRLLTQDQNNFRSNIGKKIMDHGSLTVSKILYNKTKPITSSVEVRSGDIEEDMREYFKMSEQIPTSVHLDTFVDPLNFKPKYSYGIFMQAMPETEPDYIQELDDILSSRLATAAPDLVTAAAEYRLPQFLTKELLPVTMSTQTQRRTPIDFFCRCSKESFANSLKKFQPEVLVQLHNEVAEDPTSHAGLPLRCDYCSSEYTISTQELRQMLDEKFDSKE